jgi:hypothetical protein
MLVAVAVGLNPYAAGVVLAALAAVTGRVPLSETGAAVPGAVWGLAALAFGAALPLDFVLSKFVKYAPRLRTLSHIAAPLTAALSAVSVQQSDLPVPLVAAGAALVAWGVNATVTASAARTSRAAEWVGLGHIPVLMAAAVGAVCILPLALVLPGLGWGVAGYALLTLGLTELDGRLPRSAASRRRAAARAHRAAPATVAVASATAPQPGPAFTAPVAVLPAVRNVGRASGRAYARAYARAY